MLVVTVLIVAAVSVERWLLWVAFATWLALALLTFFDIDEALRVRSRRRRRYGRHAR